MRNFVNKTRFIALAALLVNFLLAGCGGDNSGSSHAPQPPNILFVVMDDVGIDQMRSFGYGGTAPPSMPNINTIAGVGVRFRNTWSMPECSPGRASMFVGRYPFRTNVYGAIGQDDLANSQVSPYDMTTPKLLKQVNYESGMFGKFHLAGPDNSQAGIGTPAALGWDYFYGWLGADPASIDTTAGGVAPTGTYACGFVPDASQGGANSGACYLADNSCSAISGTSSAGDAPGKQCLIRGGIFKPLGTCQSPPPAGLNFDRENAYYVSPLVINSADSIQSTPLTDSRNRGYRTTLEANEAIRWIKGRSTSKPWMATVSFSSAHTPFQQAPSSLTPSTVGGGDGLNCLNRVDQRLLQNQMTEAMDTEFGRLLVETGLAQRKPDGTLVYDPKASNTMIVIVGDNGTFGATVKPPFSPPRAKGTAYQTGVWVPLIVAGPLVLAPNREIDHMVNMVDVYRLFGEIAGIDIPASVPRTIDAAPLLPYLTKVDQPSIRTLNFTMGGYNLQVNGRRNGPCVISTTCTQTPLTKAVCEDNGGVWWGAGYTDSSVFVSSGHGSSTGYQTCCQVNQALFKNGSAQVGVQPVVSTAIRNKDFKLVQNTNETYDPVSDSCANIKSNEFFAVNQNIPLPVLDNPQLDLIPSQSSWPSSLTAIYNSLLNQLASILASQPACPGDGNMDGVVNAEDLGIWAKISQLWGKSSVYDFNLDGLTNNADQISISQNLGNCPKSTAVY